MSSQLSPSPLPHTNNSPLPSSIVHSAPPTTPPSSATATATAHPFVGMANMKEAGSSQQNPNSFIDEAAKALIEKTMNILKQFVASNDLVYMFLGNLLGEERQLVHRLCEMMGLGSKSCRVAGESRTYAYKMNDEAPYQALLSRKRKNSEEPESSGEKKDFFDELSNVWITQTLKKFLASNDEVYNFEDELFRTECDLVDRLSRQLGLSCAFFGRGIRKKTSVHKPKKVVEATKVLGSLPHDTFSEESNQDKMQNKKEPEPPQHQNTIVDESTRIQISQTLEDFLASKHEAYNFEANLSPEECVAVHQLCQKMGFRVEISGSGIKQKVSVHKIEKQIHTTADLENLPCFTFSEVSKQASGGLLMHYPPSEDLQREMIGAYGDTIDRTEQKEDDFFGRPCMSEVEITKNLEDLSARMNESSDLKLINEKRSKLPIASFKDVITSTVESHQVVIICGETGCGKTTQVPQYILDHMWNKGEVCKIVCTQPQSFSVISASMRISSERGETIGNSVGYKIRFESEGGRHSSIVLCTTGVLLKVLVSKGSYFPKMPSLKDDISSISHIIMDEIHERDRYSDIMLAILREMLPSNPHLRLILLSASVDVARFSQYFGVCPIIYVPALTYPVKTYYLEDVLSIVKSRPYDNIAEVNPEVDIVLIDELIRKICTDSKDGGILVFLPGWDEIIRTRERLLASQFYRTSDFRIIFLHSTVPHNLQRGAFMPVAHGCRKIVLSTNIAESAVALDDIVYVIDTGFVKEKNYDPYTNVLTFQSFWISKESAKRREGCASRCQPGICYRLYSNIQAASLPDFQVPEIKRMPIEELCLQVKLLDPSSKIEEFLSRTLDPPGFESIRIAVGVLQEIGALSADEQLTQLGKKLGSLPVHPSIGRMLLFSILMNCLIPALILACAAEYEDPFVLPVSPEEKERSAVARSELASLYGGCYGDHFAIIAALECWSNSKKMGLQSRFCSRYFLCESTISKIHSMHHRLAEELYSNGLIHGLASSYCSNAHDPGILQAVLVAGMYPMVGKLCFPYKREKFFVKTKSGDNVCLNNHSVLSKLSSQKCFDCSLVVYDDITSSEWGVCTRDCTVVGLLPLILLSKEIAVAPAKDCTGGDEIMSSPYNKVRVTVDRWLDFESTALDASQMNYLRERLSAAILYQATHSTDVLPPVLQASVDALACILSCHGLSGIPHASYCSNELTTTINATNPKDLKTELINQDALQTNPSDVKVSESEAFENSSNHTSQNAPIGLACSTPTKQTDKTAEGFCTGLIDHNDVPSSRTSISISNGAENPSGPTYQNSATGLACSIQSAHTNDDATMIDVTPSKYSSPTMRCDDSKGKHYQNIAVEWTFPEVGWIKANVDGSYRAEQHLACCGGVFRDSTGSWCFGFVLNLGPLASCGLLNSATSTCSSYVIISEIWSIFTALKLAKDKGISQLHIETDSSLALDSVLRKRVVKDDPYAPLVQSILELLKGNWTVRFTHCYREVNQVADWLASRYAQTKRVGLHVLDVPPPVCVKYLTEECAGVFKHRKIRVGD